MEKPQSVENIVEVFEVAGRTSVSHQPPDLLIEIPHGATLRKHFEELQIHISSKVPSKLIEFFFVNTDVGTPELAKFTAEILSRIHRSYKILIVRSLIPRTFVDCNRVLGLSEEEAVSAGITVGLPVYITEEQDKEFLLERYGRYQQEVEKAYQLVCGSGGLALMLHSYAPKKVGIVAVKEDIVERLHEVYSPDQYETWPVRPQVDFIHQTPTGERLDHVELRKNMASHLETAGLCVAQGESYRLHPATTAYGWSKKYPSKTVCVEFRRDILMERFEPFSEMNVDVEQLGKIATAMAYGIMEALHQKTTVQQMEA